MYTELCHLVFHKLALKKLLVLLRDELGLLEKSCDRLCPLTYCCSNVKKKIEAMTFFFTCCQML